MELVAKLVTVAVVLLVIQELLRRAGQWVGWVTFLVVPLALAPYWLRLSDDGAYTGAGVFPWIKLVSLLVGACWLTALRFTSLGRSRWALGALFLMLPLNILEAITQDFFGGHLAHYLLGLTGILLVISVPHPLRTIDIDTAEHFHDLRYRGMTRTWIAAYTFWNWAFVYLNFPAIAGHQLAVLSSAFLVGMAESSRWLQARTFTLAIDLLVFATIPSTIIPFTDSSRWASPHGEDIAAGTCLAIAAVYAVGFFMRRGERPVEMVAAEHGAVADGGGM